MFNWIRQQVLFVMHVPGEPEAPIGAPGSTRVFRAGKNYLKLRLLGWGVTQLVVLAGIVFWAVVLRDVEETARAQQLSQTVPPPPLTPQSFVERVTNDSPSTTPPAQQNNKKKRNHIEGWAGFKRALVELALVLPSWAFVLIWGLKLIGFAIYLAQIPFTYGLRRLDYELRWYIVTDRSLRIRTGLVSLQESTMSFANLQQVEVKQDPIQRLLGLADVHVQSAGGGGHDPSKGKAGDSLHTGIFHSVENAKEIRDLILERLRRFRQAGLGDPDDHHDATFVDGVIPPREAVFTSKAEPSEASPADTLAAAREVLVEARALRATLALK
jgi:membrane protein YdbS with pleckstrin-like domain